MLLKFQVKNFKQFENLTFDFENVRDYKINKDCLVKKGDVLKTALIYGPNASGKSNIGLAIFDIVQHLFDLHTDPIGYSNYLNADNPTEAAWFSYKFKFNKDIVLYEYSKLDSRTVVAEALFINDKPVFNHRFYAWDDKISDLNSKTPDNIKDRSDAAKKITAWRVVKGNKIDIFVNSHAEALQWGVRYLNVSVVN